MKRLQITKEQIETVASFYDGVSFFYDHEKQEAIMLQDVLDTDLSSASFNRDTTAIVPVSETMVELLPLLAQYSLDAKTLIPRSLTQKLKPDEVKVFNLLALHTLLINASFVESIDEPDKTFLLIDIANPHANEKASGLMESAIKKIRSIESDVYLYQTGKKCQKKLQK